MGPPDPFLETELMLQLPYLAQLQAHNPVSF